MISTSRSRTFGVWAFGTWFGIPAQQAIVASLSDPARGTMLAFNSSALNLGGVIGPVVTGRVLEAGGFGVAAPWASVVGLAALVLAWRVLPNPDQTAAATTAREANPDDREGTAARASAEPGL